MRNTYLDKKIKTLRTFFRISNAAFEFQNSIQLACSGHIVQNEMQQLHKIALFEIEKENPDLSLIDNLLAEMENLAELNSQPNKKFQKGGVDPSDLRNRTLFDKLKERFICNKKGHTVSRVHPKYPSKYCSVCRKHRSEF